MKQAAKVAKRVQVAGRFNDWNPGRGEMSQDPISGAWSIRLRIPKGAYQYRYVVDGEWIEVPVMRLTPKDLAVLIDRFQVLFERPSVSSQAHGCYLQSSFWWHQLFSTRVASI